MTCCSEYLANKKNTLNDVALIQAPKGQGCPRCGGMVYAAEQVLAKGRVSIHDIHDDIAQHAGHRVTSCFTCVSLSESDNIWGVCVASESAR